MKTYTKYHLIILFILVLFSNSFTQELNQAEESSLVLGVENDFITRYIWQGLECNNGLIHQPTVWITLEDFTFFTWASITQHEDDNNEISNELDFAVKYSKQIDMVNLESSLTYIYCLQEDYPPTAEMFLRIGLDLYDYEIYSDLTTDVMEYSGSTSGNLGVNKNLFENDNLSVQAGLSIGWANKLFNKNYVGAEENLKPFNYTMFSVEAVYYVYDKFYIKPHIEYFYLFSPAYKQSTGNSLENFGIAAGVEF